MSGVARILSIYAGDMILGLVSIGISDQFVYILVGLTSLIAGGVGLYNIWSNRNEPKVEHYIYKKDAPKAFHYFFWASLPASICGIIMRVFQMGRYYWVSHAITSSQVFRGWIVVVDSIYFVVLVIVLLVCFFGFFKWSSQAWKAVKYYLYLTVAHAVCYACLTPEFRAGYLAGLVDDILFNVLGALIIGRYYDKRKALFFPDLAAQLRERARILREGEREGRAKLFPSQPNIPAQYCHICGHKLVNDSRFCSNCGKQVEGR